MSSVADIKVAKLGMVWRNGESDNGDIKRGKDHQEGVNEWERGREKKTESTITKTAMLDVKKTIASEKAVGLGFMSYERKSVYVNTIVVLLAHIIFHNIL